MAIEQKTCQNCKATFVISPTDAAFHAKIGVPPPTFCPDCRTARRINFRNVRSLYHRKCDLCGIAIITMYHVDDPVPVYCNPCWHGDGWEASTYAQEIDWSRPFFEQWHELYQKVPRFALWKIGNLVNSEYTNYSVNSKDCYLAYSIVDNENIRYSENVDRSRAIMDSLYLKDSESCYENIDCTKNYDSLYCMESRDCIGSAFLFDCVNCQNCFMSANLRNRQYVFRGEQLTKESYAERIKDELNGSHTKIEALRSEFQSVVKNAIHRYAQIFNSPGATGNNVINSKNVRNGFSVYEAEDIANSMRVLANTKEVMDGYGIAQGELIYESVATSFGVYRNSFCFFNDATKDVQYSALCRNGSDLFGCVGIKGKQYCILNKQYSKEEYETLMPKVIAHMNANPYVTPRGITYRHGEFYPFEFSPFAYNETLAYDNRPIPQQEAVERGYQWKLPEKRSYNITKQSDELPDAIDDVADIIIDEVIACGHAGTCDDQCTYAFRIAPEDVQFYRMKKIPLPRLCPNCRHYARLKKRAPTKLWHRICMCDPAVRSNSAVHAHHPTGKCSNEFETSYAPEGPETIYCEQCYQAEVV